MALKNPYAWRWIHSRHHTDTIVVGGDPEIAFPRPLNLWGMVLNLLKLKTGPIELGKLVVQAGGRINPEAASHLPASEHPKVIRIACLYFGVLGATVLCAVLSEGDYILGLMTICPLTILSASVGRFNSD